MKTALSNTAQVESQEDISFPEDDRHAILSKMNKKLKRNRERTNTNN